MDSRLVRVLPYGGPTRQSHAPSLTQEGDRAVLRRNGFTLVEMLMVVIVVGLGLLIALPKFRTALGQSNLVSARAAVIGMHSVARATAASGRSAVVRMTGNTVYVTATPRLKPGAGTRDTVALPRNMSSIYGVTLSPSVDTILIDQTGIGRNGSDIILTKSTFKDTIEVNTYGRVQK